MHRVGTSQAGTLAIANYTSVANCSLPYESDRVPLVVLYSFVFMVGLPANLATVYMTILQVHRKNVLGIYLLSLSLCDLMYLGTLPLWALYVNAGHRWPLSSLACKVTGYVFFNNMYISIFLLCCVSVDRCVAVVYAVESRGLRKQKVAAAVTLLICVVVAAGHLNVFFMSEGEVGNSEDQGCFEPGHSSPTVAAFNYARFLVGFLIPLVILGITNRAIMLNVQASSGLQSRQKEKVKFLVVAVVTFFLVCFAPYHLILLMRAVTFHSSTSHDKCSFERQVYTPYTISLGLSTLNSALNPLLYVLASDSIRKEIHRGLASLRSGSSSLRARHTDSGQRGHSVRNSQ